MAGPFVVAGVYIMFLAERLSLDAMAAAEESNCDETLHAESHGHCNHAITFGDVEKDGELKPHSHEHLSAISAARSIVAKHSGHAHGASILILPTDTSGKTKAAAPAIRRQVLNAHLLEISIVVHSLIIGLNLGTSETLADITSLIIVLCFHQFFEGLALGSFLADLKDAASLRAKFTMAIIFSLAVPAGCWIGIGVASAYDAESYTAAWVNGALNGLTGGMLLYTALITFMAEEFSRDDLSGKAGRAVKRNMYAVMVFGASAMALLGIWA